MRRCRFLPLLFLALLTASCGDLIPLQVTDPDGRRGQAERCALGVSDGTALERIALLQSLVAGLEADGALNDGNAQALTNHLANAARHIPDGRYCPARAQLEAFQRQVEAFRRGDLTDRQASPMLMRVRPVLATEEPRATDPEAYAPGATGELRTVEVDGNELTYEVIDGLAIYQSDMVLGYADEYEARVAGLTDAAPAAAGADRPEIARSGICSLSPLICDRWTDVVMGYAIADDWDGATGNALMRARIDSAITHWETNTTLRFEQRLGGERLVFRDAGGCSSSIGRQIVTGIEPQYINIGETCRAGSVVHEIGHALGLYHEQSRDDREDSVSIDFGAIADGQIHNFFQYLVMGHDVGPYDFSSIMHYGCWAWLRDGLTRRTINPVERPNCDGIGQRDRLSEGDIAGFYTLYPPDYTITGATYGASGDRFSLALAFDHGAPRDDHIVWWSNRRATPLGTGPTLELRGTADMVGTHLISAQIRVAEMTLATRVIELTLANTAPSVSLGPDRNVDLDRAFRVEATVSDAEDGACLPTVCTYEWSPAPNQDFGTSAGYTFGRSGPRTLSLTVTDRGGQSTTATVEVNVINTPPAVVIVGPTAGARFSEGGAAVLSAYATDVNETAPGEHLPCDDMRWSSSDPSDVLFTDCTTDITFGTPGPRTLTARISDPDEPTTLSGSATVEVEVLGCGANCPPVATIMMGTPTELDGSIYTPPFSGSGYYLTTPIQAFGYIGDPDSALDDPLTYEWRLEQLCLPGACPETVLASGTVAARTPPSLRRVSMDFTPGDHLAQWTDCETQARRYFIVLEVTDSHGASVRTSHEIHLACSLI